MLRTVFVVLAVVAAIFAQGMVQEMPPPEIIETGEASSTTTERPLVEEHPVDEEPLVVEHPTDLTGENDEYRKVVKGDLEEDPKNFRLYIQDAHTEQYLSYWSDIPLFFNTTTEEASGEGRFVNMVVEIVRGEGLKTEMAWDMAMNPIRAVLDESEMPVDEHIDYIHHYGTLPQTYADPSVADTLSELVGDGHAMDVVEISDSMHEIGDVVPVKVLGLLGVLIDEKTIDYQIIAIDIRSSFADQINTLEDVELHFPDLLSATRGFFRYYRYPEKLYEIAFEGQYKDVDAAMNVIKERHEQWLNLIKSPSPPTGLNTECHQPEAAFQANDDQWKSIVESE